MSERDYYPAGAYDDPDAPWNQVERDPKDFDVEVTVFLIKSTKVSDNRYYHDEMGVLETENCDFLEDFKEQHIMPSQLLAEYAEVLKERVARLKEEKPAGYRSKVMLLNEKIADCLGWKEEDIEL